jgi:hypothetical protein
MMQIAGTILVLIGVLYVYMIIMRPPFLMNNIKVKIMVKKMGLKGFWIFFLIWTALVLGGGITLLLLA